MQTRTNLGRQFFLPADVRGAGPEPPFLARRSPPLRAIAFGNVTAGPAGRVGEAIEALGTADLLRLKRVAQFRARSLPGVEWADLLQEAMIRALAGDRHWPPGITFVAFLAGVMRSLAEELWRQHRARRRLLPLTAPEAVRTPDETRDIERELHARHCLAAIEGLFALDQDALAVIRGLADGLAAAEIQARTGMDATRYATTRRRIRRTLQRCYDGLDRP
jgi:RNA polymerase sigma-70 factor (ECF subfamily)